MRLRNRDKRNARTNIYESIQPSLSTQCPHASEEQITFMTQTPPYSTIEVESPKQDEKAARRGGTFVDFFLSVLENFRAFIVYATLHKLEAFNMRERQALNRVEIAKSR